MEYKNFSSPPETVLFKKGQIVMLDPEATKMPGNDFLFPHLQGKRLRVLFVDRRVDPVIAQNTGAAFMINIAVAEGSKRKERYSFVNTILTPWQNNG